VIKTESESLLWYSTVLGVNSAFVQNKSTAAPLMTGRLFFSDF
jgi:hypothetical protein